MLRQLTELWRSHDLLEESWHECFQMLGTTHDMFLRAVEVLRRSEGTELGEEILRRDRTVDAFQQEVRRKVMTHCTIHPHADLPAAMVLITIVGDIERIGDYAKNIVELARHYPARLEGGPLEQDLQRVEATVEANFGRARRSIEESDEAPGREVLEETRWLSRLCDERLHGLVRAPAPELTSGQTAALALYLRHLKRINGHLGDVATSVVHPFDRIGFKSPS